MEDLEALLTAACEAIHKTEGVTPEATKLGGGLTFPPVNQASDGVRLAD